MAADDELILPYDDYEYTYEPTTAEEKPSEQPRIWHYFHSFDVGLQLIGKGGNTDLANFRPTLVREVELRDGDGEMTCEYDVRFELSPSESIEVRLHPEDIKSDRAFRERLTTVLPLSKYVIYPRGWTHIMPAMGELAALRTHTKEVAYASMGWVSYSPMVYLLPGAEGIGADGTVPRLVMDKPSIERLPGSWQNYGRGMRPMHEDLEMELVTDAFVKLLSLGPTAAVIATQVLAGPLSPFGARITPPLVHVQGETGSFKTTISLLCLSLTGIFGGEASIPETWTSTHNSLMRSLSDAKDVTLLIDDYKHTKSYAEPTNLVQNYADTATRSRLAPDQERRKRLVPRGLLLSTGEDMWEGFQSTAARTIVLLAHRPSKEDLPEFITSLNTLQDYASKGLLALVGGTWVQWLASQSPAYIDAVYREYRDARLSTVDTSHMRLSATLASLLAVADMVARFLAERLPDAAPAYADAMTRATDALLTDTTEQGKESEIMSPYEWAMSQLGQALGMGQISFLHRSSTVALPLGKISGEVIGYYDESNVYLTRHSTYYWFQRRAAGAHIDLHFSWHALLQATRTALGPYTPDGVTEDKRASYVCNARGATIRALVIPRSELDKPS